MKNRKLQKVEGQKFLYTDGERLYGRRFPKEENSTEEGERLIGEVEKDPTEFIRRYDDNMISGDDGTRIRQKQQDETKQAYEEVIIPNSPEKSEEKKEVANEAITGKNIDKSAESGVNKKTLMTELTDEEIKKWEAENNEVRADLKQQNELKQQKVREKIKQQKDHD